MKNTKNKIFKRRCIFFIGPGKTGSSSIFLNAKNNNQIQLVNKNIKDTFIHSYDDLKFTNYSKVLWRKKNIDKINEDFKSLIQTKSDKKLVLFEMSYIFSKRALKFCAKSNSLVVISLRNTFDRALSNLMMDYRLGIISIRDIENCKKKYIEQCELYLKISNIENVYKKLIKNGQKDKDIMFIDIFNLKIYSKNSINKEFKLVKSLLKGSLKMKENEASDFRFSFLSFLFRFRYLRLIYRIPIFKFFKKYINKILFKKNNSFLKSKLNKYLSRDYKEKFDFIEKSNNKFLKKFNQYNI